MADDKIKVLYIAGPGRSGSTILGNILGEIDGFFHAGELRHVWAKGLIENRLCGCGARFRECNLWRAVLDKAFGGMNQIDAHELVRLCRVGTSSRHIPLMFAPGGKSYLKNRLGYLLVSLEKLYRAIRDVTNSSVITDSSKFPAYGFALGMIPSIDLHVLHLVRDPRAVAYSWMRNTFVPEEETYMPRMSAGKSSIKWSLWNIAIPFLGKVSRAPYLRLCYEDCLGNPMESVKHIFELVKEKPSRLPFIAPNRVQLSVNHTTLGNPNRFRKGTVELQLDDEWKVAMKWKHKFLVTAITWPLLLRYHYVGNG